MESEGKKQLLSALGMARRAGKLAMGRTNAKAALHRGKAEMILLSSDISPALERELRYLVSLEKAPIPVLKADVSISEIYMATSMKAGVAAVTDKNFAKKIMMLLGA